MKEKAPKAHEVDFYTGKDEIDREEAAFLAREAEKHADQKPTSWFYKTFVAWLF